MFRHGLSHVTVTASCAVSLPFLDVQAAGSARETALEPGEGPWPAAAGFPGPPQCRPISTITQLLTWQPPTAGVQHVSVLPLLSCFLVSVLLPKQQVI